MVTTYDQLFKNSACVKPRKRGNLGLNLAVFCWVLNSFRFGGRRLVVLAYFIMEVEDVLR